MHAAAKKAGAEVEAKDAVVTFSGRTPTVKAHVAGLALDDASISAEVWKAIGGTARTATGGTKPTQPTFTTDIAKKTLPKEKISSFTTYYQAGQPRVHNIKLASRVINGTYVPPGEQFSMNAVLGQRTAAKGYVEAGIIRDGRAAESVGGGISQVSTTIFNAAFFAGCSSTRGRRTTTTSRATPRGARPRSRGPTCTTSSPTPPTAASSSRSRRPTPPSP